MALAMKSPAAVAIHDKQAWMDIFASINILEDPVGSKPHLSGVYDAKMAQRGFGPLGRFYDTFIAPMQICFHIERDIICGLHVVRDLSIEIQMSEQVIVHVPMHLLYELTDQQGELKIQRLAAHWELAPMLKQQMTFGWASLKAGNNAGIRMFKHLGLLGTIGFMRALKTIGQQGKDNVEAFVFGLVGESEKLQDLFQDNAQFQLLLPEGKTLGLEQLRQSKPRLSTSKMLAAGNFVTVSCSLEFEAVSYVGVAFFEFNMRSALIVNVRLYMN